MTRAASTLGAIGLGLLVVGAGLTTRARGGTVVVGGAGADARAAGALGADARGVEGSLGVIPLVWDPRPVSAPGPELNMPVFVVGDATQGTDHDGARAARLFIRRLYRTYRGMSEEALDGLVLRHWAVLPNQWPDTLELAQESVGIFNQTGGAASSKPISWFRPIEAALASPAHRCEHKMCPNLHHHLGCLYSHLGVISRGLASGYPYFVGWESDAPTLNSVSPLDFPVVAQHLPEDADMVWMVRHHEATGQFVKKFPSTATGTHPFDEGMPYRSAKSIYLYRFDQFCGWAGLQSYMFTRKGAEKVRDFIKDFREVDMIDAWLAGHCMRVCNRQRSQCMNLNCYTAQSVRVPESQLGGFLPEWYSTTDDQVMEVSKPILDQTLHNHDAYNKLGCQRESFTPWIPVGYDDVRAADADVAGCLDPRAAKARDIDVCAPSARIPLLNPAIRAARLAARLAAD